MRALTFALTASLLVASHTAVAQSQLSIATGGTGGTYYPYGGGLAELIKKHVDGYDAVAEVTGASVENMGLVWRGDSDLALALADTVYQGATGTGDFEGRKLENIRAIASIYPNAVQIVTMADSGIDSLDDLEGKVVSVGARVAVPNLTLVPSLRPTASAMTTSTHGASTSTKPLMPCVTAISMSASGVSVRPPARF